MNNPRRLHWMYYLALLLLCPGSVWAAASGLVAIDHAGEKSSALSLTENATSAESLSFMINPLKIGWYNPATKLMQKKYGSGGALLSEIEVGYFVKPWFLASISSGFLNDYGHKLDTNFEPNGEDIDILLLPITINAIFRLNTLATAVVPYAGWGLDYIFWREDIDWNGNYGFQVRAGCSFILDSFDRKAANRLRQKTDVKNTSLVIEARWMLLDNFSLDESGANLSALVFSSGMQFEL